MLRITSLLLLAALFALPILASAQPASPVGVWRTFEDGQPKSIVRISESGGVLTGTIVNLLPEGRTCGDCVDTYPSDGPVAAMRGRRLIGQNLQGLIVLSGFSDRDGDGRWEGGQAFKPDEGKTYSGWMEVQPDGRLKLRGGYRTPFGMLGKTQYWVRVN